MGPGGWGGVGWGVGSGRDKRDRRREERVGPGGGWGGEGVGRGRDKRDRKARV